MLRIFMLLFCWILSVPCRMNVQKNDVNKIEEKLHAKHKEVKNKIINSTYFSKAEKIQLGHHLDEMYKPECKQSETKKQN